MDSRNGYELQSISPSNEQALIDAGIEHNKIEFESWGNPVTNTVAWFTKGQNEIYACLYNSELVPTESIKFAIRFTLDLNGYYIPVKPLTEIVVVTGGRN
ncbi:hypothetical protein P886_1977 [Alteromonadaceae bacterium 2753L.S.0a.02]|nr:hypothetical protein P886_1977 [Alteromonadaceae bacterium 2753L.S.0a.02]